ncbi:Alpha/Beta hydrolase protein [Mycena rosella]|uniref:Alpha/Beta hydrolase protein n=1 Tax=Mycena rosella TaxID=1033263 RepID=A0AAD7C6I8_MYCRO|nr:Alpha/Beta hydrolase protein [Mycena rosella]
MDLKPLPPYIADLLCCAGNSQWGKRSAIIYARVVVSMADPEIGGPLEVTVTEALTTGLKGPAWRVFLTLEPPSIMDPASYKDFVTPRGINYHYFFSPAAAGKPTLVFLHGFPSNAHECWRHQVVFFVKQGYGVLASDLLGYGGTDKPTDVAMYAKSLMSADIISIMDRENINFKVYAIGHDWGCALTSGLATFYPSRFAGFAFLALGYLTPNPEFEINSFYAGFKAIAGHECFGYWHFFKEDGADKIIADHMDAFMSILYPQDPKSWLTDMAPRDKLKEWVVSDKVTPPPSYLTEEDFTRQKTELLKGGMAGPLCWYKQYATGVVVNDDKLVPKENYIIKQPVFFAATHEDYICVPKVALVTMKDVCPILTVRDYQTDHWVQIAQPAKIARKAARKKELEGNREFGARPEHSIIAIRSTTIQNNALFSLPNFFLILGFLVAKNERKVGYYCLVENANANLFLKKAKNEIYSCFPDSQQGSEKERT